MTYFGILGRTRSLLVLASLATAAALPTLRPADAAANHDGIWSVVIITNQGICDPSYRYPIRISKGSVLNAGNAAVTITGKVEKNGAVVVNVAAGDKTATGTGKLAATSGGGSWSGGNGACSGVWQAERRSS
ncbi:MAG TPA: hypothetical protein VKD43_07425 [Xanthobacteraceae bacterium]|nr:hypothetical protein [Xanthobacteraceae bacterium]